MKIKRIEHGAIAVDNIETEAGMLRNKFGSEVEYGEDRAASAWTQREPPRSWAISPVSRIGTAQTDAEMLWKAHKALPEA